MSLATLVPIQNDPGAKTLTCGVCGYSRRVVCDTEINFRCENPAFDLTPAQDIKATAQDTFCGKLYNQSNFDVNGNYSF